jgi:cell division initiation protein
MRLTPLDIRKQEFKKSMRGLDPEEVYAFLTTIADEYEAVLNDNKALRERLLELDDKVQEYRNMEKTLRDTLLTAERVTVESKDNAMREADLIIKEAQLEADKAARAIKANASKLRIDVQDLKRQREAYIARMKMLVESHAKFLDSADRDFSDEDKRLEDELKDWADGQEEEVRTPSRPLGDHPEKKPGASPSPPDVIREAPVRSGIPRRETSEPTRHRPAGPSPKRDEGDGASADMEASQAGGHQPPERDGTAGLDESRLNSILDQMAEGQRAVLQSEPEAPQAQAHPRPENTASNTPNTTSEWSLEKLKRDIALGSAADDETT